MMLVMVSLVLLLALLGVVYRQVAAVIRVEMVRARLLVRDEGGMSAVAQGLVLLENGPPPSDPYTFRVTVPTSSGSKTYAVTIASEGNQLWSVHSVPAAPGP